MLPSNPSPYFGKRTTSTPRCAGFFILSIMYEIRYTITHPDASDQVRKALPSTDTYNTPDEAIACFLSIPQAKEGAFTATLYANGNVFGTKKTNF